MAAGQPSTMGGAGFDPDQFVKRWSAGELSAPTDHDLQTPTRNAFNLPHKDTYVYHAIASVTLTQVQQAINHGAASGMHAWYLDSEGKRIDPPPVADINAYTTIFSSTTSTSKALTALASNAKKSSTRASIAASLTSKRLFPSNITIPKLKTSHANPYLDYWAWSCRELEWAGPDAATVNTKQSHHILPIFYHHFGCVCPSFEALETIRQLTKGRVVIEAGSGNGYWTYMLRRLGLTVHAVDNGDSVWRTMWIGDTIKSDAAKYLQRATNAGGKDAVLLMVYPQVTTQFTTDTLRAYKGDTICVAGTQNANGFTGFKDVGFEEYLGREKGDFEKIVQTPLPSFAGKDEAFFVFQRKS